MKRLTHPRMRRLITDESIMDVYLDGQGLGGRVDYPCLGHEANEYARVAVNAVLRENRPTAIEFPVALQQEIAKAFIVGMALAFAHVETPWVDGDEKHDPEAHQEEQ